MDIGYLIITPRDQVQHIRMNRKILYHFAIFTIVGSLTSAIECMSHAANWDLLAICASSFETQEQAGSSFRHKNALPNIFSCS